VFRAFVRSMGSTLIVGSAYHNNTNAKVERANGVIGDTLRAFAGSAQGLPAQGRRQLPFAVKVPLRSSAARQSSPPQSSHPVATGGAADGGSRAVFRLGPLAGLARAYVLGNVNLLSHPEGEAANQRPRLGPPKVPPERPVVALAENLRPQTPPAGMHSRSAAPCPRRYSRPHLTKNVPPGGV
jgi:hypothetical protein